MASTEVSAASTAAFRVGRPATLAAAAVMLLVAMSVEQVDATVFFRCYVCEGRPEEECGQEYDSYSNAVPDAARAAKRCTTSAKMNIETGKILVSRGFAPKSTLAYSDGCHWYETDTEMGGDCLCSTSLCNSGPPPSYKKQLKANSGAGHSLYGCSPVACPVVLCFVAFACLQAVHRRFA